jgi:hypothetical protein
MENTSRKTTWSTSLIEDMTWAMQRQFRKLILSTFLLRVVEGEAGFELIDLHCHGKKVSSMIAPMKFLVVQIPFLIGEGRPNRIST